MTAPFLRAPDVAKYFLAAVDVEAGDNMTHLKLQKLLYYAQGFHVAMRDGEPMFPESLLAWKHGPVVSQVYRIYRDCGRQPIDPPSTFDRNEFAPEVREILDAVNSVYGQYTAPALERMTHEEPPWQKTRMHTTIPRALLTRYFSKLVEAGKTGESVDGRPVWPTNSFRFQRRRELSGRMDVYRDRLRSAARRDLLGTV
jgi:uncharacterized phage-associated protein